MTRWLQLNDWLGYDDVRIVFANTGQEHDETLDFVQRCDAAFGWGVVWVEAVIDQRARKGTTHRVVNHNTAARDSRIFEDVVRKYGIPNKSYPHCNRELKLRPMESYMRSIGWRKYDTAIGIRVDEIDRMSVSAAEKGLIYPLIRDRPTTKPQINAWWESQPFRLNLAGYEGNCKWCWKKSLRKLLTIASRNPEWFDFPLRAEAEYAFAGANKDGNPRVFFRERMSTVDILNRALIGGFDDADDDNRKYPDTIDGVPLDVAGACSESCDIHADDEPETTDTPTAWMDPWAIWRDKVLS